MTYPTALGITAAITIFCGLLMFLTFDADPHPGWRALGVMGIILGVLGVAGVIASLWWSAAA